MNTFMRRLDHVFYWMFFVATGMSVMFFNHDLHNYQVGKSAIFIMLGGTAALYMLLQDVRDDEWQITPLFIAFCCYMLSYPLSLIGSVNRHLSYWGSYEYQGGIAFILIASVIFLSLHRIKHDRKMLERVLWAIIVPGVIHSLIAILQSFDLLGAVIHEGGAPRPWGLLGNSNISGDYIATIALIPLYFAFAKRGLEQVLGIFALIFLMYGLYLSECRGAMLGVVAGLGLGMRVYFHIFKSWKYYLPVYLSLFFPDVLPYQTRLRTFNMRFSMWKLSLASLFDYPLFGNGYKNFPFAFYPLRTKEFLNTMQIESHQYEYFFSSHNNYIEIMIERGLWGFLSYLAIFTLAFTKLIRTIKAKAHDQELRFFCFALIGTLGSFLVWTAANWETLATIPIIFLVFVVVTQLEGEEKRWTIRNRFASFAIFFVFLPVILFTIYHQSMLYSADKKFAQVIRAQVPDRIETLENLIEKVLPSRHYYTFTYARLKQQELGAASFNELKRRIATRALEFINPNVDIQFEPNNLRFLKFKFEMVLGDVQKAEKTLSDMLKLDPIHYTALTEQAKIDLNHHNNLPKAISLLNEAIEIKPNYMDAVVVLSQIEAKQGQKEKAIERLSALTKHYPEKAVAIQNLITKISQ